MPAIIDSLLTPLDSCIKGNREMLFHFLWSRIIDECWWDLYNKEFNSNQGPPSIAFIVYPLHAFQCGTNFDFTSNDDQLAISWSYDLFSDFFNLPKTASFYSAVMSRTIPEQDRKFLITHGLLDSSGRSKIFTYHEGDIIDSTCSLLKSRFINMMTGRFDYKKLGIKYHVPPDELFIVMGHEIAYEIFQFLGEKGIPIPIKKSVNPTLNFKYLVSIEFSKP